MTDDEVPVVLLRINALWQPGMHVDEVYDAAHGWWVVGQRRHTVDYALAVAHGIVRGVFRVDGWRQRQQSAGLVKWAFEGEAADELVDLLGADVHTLFKRGAQNPVSYGTLMSVRAAAAGAQPPATDDRPSSEPDEPDEPDEDLLPVGETASATPPGSVDVIVSTCARLRDNPVLHVSLGSKELFHSNLLAWFIERYPALAVEALHPWLEPGGYEGPVDVRREEHQLDIVAQLPGFRPLVFENKVFSLPDEAQLDRYTLVNIPAAGIGSPTKLLLSLHDPSWPNDRHLEWHFLPWPALARRLADVAHRLADLFERGLVERWSALVLDLERLVQATAPSKDELLRLDDQRLAALDGVRLGDALQKSRSRAVLHLLKRSWAEQGLPMDKAESSFTRGQPLLSGGLRMPDDSLVGWQLQGRQWRRFVIVPDELAGRAPSLRQARADYVGNVHRSWFVFETEAAIRPVTPAVGNDLKHYAPDFVYDYVKVNAVTVDDVLTLGTEVLRDAMKHRDRLARNDQD